MSNVKSIQCNWRVGKHMGLRPCFPDDCISCDEVGFGRDVRFPRGSLRFGSGSVFPHGGRTLRCVRNVFPSAFANGGAGEKH